MTDANRGTAAIFEALKKPAVAAALDAMAPDGRGIDYIVGSLRDAIKVTPAIKGLRVDSVVRCALLAAKLGLPLGEYGVYLTPRQGAAVPVIDYRALVDMALEHPGVAAINTGVIRDGDHFENDIGDTLKPITHRVLMGNRGPLVGAWADLIFTGGHHCADVMPEEEILACRPSSWQKTPWNSPHVGEMYRKTIARRVLKYAPKTPRLRMALAVEDAVDSGDETFGIELPASLEGKPPERGAPPPQRKEAAKPASAPEAVRGGETVDTGAPRMREALAADGAPQDDEAALAAARGDILADVDAVAHADPSVDARLREALKAYDGKIGNLKTLAELESLRKFVFAM